MHRRVRQIGYRFTAVVLLIVLAGALVFHFKSKNRAALGDRAYAIFKAHMRETNHPLAEKQPDSFLPVTFKAVLTTSPSTLQVRVLSRPALVPLGTDSIQIINGWFSGDPPSHIKLTLNYSSGEKQTRFVANRDPDDDALAKFNATTRPAGTVGLNALGELFELPNLGALTIDVPETEIRPGELGVSCNSDTSQGFIMVSRSAWGDEAKFLTMATLPEIGVAVKTSLQQTGLASSDADRAVAQAQKRLLSLSPEEFFLAVRDVDALSLRQVNDPTDIAETLLLLSTRQFVNPAIGNVYSVVKLSNMSLYLTGQQSSDKKKRAFIIYAFDAAGDELWNGLVRMPNDLTMSDDEYVQEIISMVSK